MSLVYNNKENLHLTHNEYDDETTQQQILLTLQKIDSNFGKAHDVSSKLLNQVKEHGDQLKKIHSSIQIWKSFFNSFTEFDDETIDQIEMEEMEDNDPQEKISQQNDSSCTKSLTPKEMQFRTCIMKDPMSRHDQSSDDSFNSMHLGITMAQLTSQENMDVASTPFNHTSSSNYYRSTSDRNLSPPKSTRLYKPRSRMDASSISIEEPKEVVFTPKPSDMSSSSDSIQISLSSEVSKKRYPMTPLNASRMDSNSSVSMIDGDNSFDTPTWSTPRTASIRRTYSNMTPRNIDPSPSDHLTKSLENKFNKLEMQTEQGNEEDEDVTEVGGLSYRGVNDSLMTPCFKSPLLSTKLRAMTPRTPLSNRLAGACFEVGTPAHERMVHSVLEEEGEEPPEFDLSLFPQIFQRGTGAVQLSSVYSKFQGSNRPSLCLEQLHEMLPEFGTGRLELLLETLVSRRILRPFVVQGELYWQRNGQ